MTSSCERYQFCDSLPKNLECAILEREMSKGDDATAFFMCNLKTVTKQLERWNTLLPNISPYYAVKCNPDATILKLLKDLGTGFDCASEGEIRQVLELGVDPSRIIFANPCKFPQHITFARQNGVKRMTFDNESELRSIERLYPEAELVLRIMVDDSKSSVRMSCKYGAELACVEDLLKLAKDLRLNVIGVSFHVGSGCYDAELYFTAIRTARGVFDAASQLGLDLTLLDIGGGFPGTEDEAILFNEISQQVLLSLSCYFDAATFPNLEIIAEPGTFFVASCCSLVCKIISCRPSAFLACGESGKETKIRRNMYYLNEGVYGSFGCVAFKDNPKVNPKVLSQNGRFLNDSWPIEGSVFPSVLWGPTCDSADCILDDIQLPNLCVGDWLMFENMGAYTGAASSSFNGFLTCEVIYFEQ